MRKTIKLVLALLFCSALTFPTHAGTIQGKVVGVSDGDTISVLDADQQQYKIRLAGIDAPEKSQPYGQRSKEHLSDMVFGKTVSVDLNKKDKYGRTVGKVTVAGVDANLSQVTSGLAWHYKDYQKEQSPEDRVKYSQAEETARNRHAGLWSDTHPIPPWDFRHGTGEADTKPVTHSTNSCPCSGNTLCTGPRGGQFCLTASGGKKYR